MTKSSLTAVLCLCALLALATAAPPAAAQEAGDGPRPSGLVQEPERGREGRRLGNMPNDQIRQFQMRRACEEDRPDCLPQIREMLERERRNQMWMGIGIGGVLLLIVLLAMREAEKKKKRQAAELARHKRLGQKLKSKWGDEVRDPYKNADPLGDD